MSDQPPIVEMDEGSETQVIGHVEDGEVRLMFAPHVFRFYTPPMARRLGERLIATADVVEFAPVRSNKSDDR